MFSRPVRGGRSQRHERAHRDGYDDSHSHRYRGSGSYGSDDIAYGQSMMRMRSTRDFGHGPHLHRERRISSTYSKAAFGKALQQLHTTLKDSIQFFRAFEKNYLEETHAIKAYTTPQIMDELWTAKAVNSDTDPSSCPSRSSRSDYGRDRRWLTQQPPVPYTSPRGGKFRDHIQYIKEDFENALNCSPSRSHRKEHYREGVGIISGGDDSGASARLDAESTERLMRKIAEQYKVLGKILCNIYKVRSYVQEFIKESELLAGYLEKSRNRWQPEEREQPTRRQGRKEQESRYLQDEKNYDSDQQGQDSQDDRDSVRFDDDLNHQQPDEW